MKANKNVLVLRSLLLIVMLLSGCGRQTSNDKTLPPPSSNPPLNTVLTSTPSLVLASSPTPSAMPTAVSTLSAEKARVKLLNLLSTNGHCQLPCLWGITPGESKYPEFQAALMPLSSISDLTAFKADGGAINPLYIEGDLILNTRVSFLIESQIVKRISFAASEEKKITTPEGGIGFAEVFDSVDFGRRASYFMLPHVLTEQGRPDAVVISTLASPVTRTNSTIVGGFDTVLLYPGQGLLVHYTTQMQLDGEKVRGCMANAHVELELYPSGERDSFAEYLASTKWAGMWPVPNNLYWKPIENATTMTLDQFYETFRQPTEKCIETPASLWPTPGP